MPREIDELVRNQQIAEKALNNAYRIITGKITIEGLFEEALIAKEKIDQEIYLPFDPDKKIPSDTIDILLEHYIYTEEYEKCAELVKIQKRKKKNGR
tara:strand:+ start:391 stop:681 length:291 start_codon:yes stop_codon:yes gene_type:complete